MKVNYRGYEVEIKETSRFAWVKGPNCIGSVTTDLGPNSTEKDIKEWIDKEIKGKKRRAELKALFPGIEVGKIEVGENDDYIIFGIYEILDEQTQKEVYQNLFKKIENELRDKISCNWYDCEYHIYHRTAGRRNSRDPLAIRYPKTDETIGIKILVPKDKFLY